MTHRVFANETDCAVFEETVFGDLSPLTDPVNHLAELGFHSSLDNFVLAMPPATVPITHPAVAADGGVGFSSAALTLAVYLGRFPNDLPVLTHGLGYPPIVLVLDSSGYAIPNAFPIQRTTSGSIVIGHREVSVYVTDTEVRMKDIGIPGYAALPELDATYTVYVFKTPAIDPSKPMLLTAPGNVIFGQGKFDGSEPRLRRTITGETSDLLLPKGRMTDIANGAARYVHGDGTYEDITSSTVAYTGSFTGSGVMEAVVI